MFSLFKKSSGPSSVDRVWKTGDQCYRGIVAEAAALINASRSPVVFFFFEDEKRRFVDYLTAGRVEHQLLESGQISSGAKASLIVADAFAISTTGIDLLLRAGKVAPLRILFRGHYPLIEPEEKVIEKVKGLITEPAVFCLSLEDSLFKQFAGGDNITTIMEKMGFADNEFIEHSLVSAAILRARRKVSERVTSEMRARSEADWFAKNLMNI